MLATSENATVVPVEKGQEGYVDLSHPVPLLQRANRSALFFYKPQHCRYLPCLSVSLIDMLMHPTLPLFLLGSDTSRTKEVDSVKNVAATESTTTTNPAPAADVVMDTPTDGESDEDDRMEVDDEHAELELEENDMAEIDASNILTSRTRGVKIDFANLPEEERLGADEDDEEDADVVMDDE
ncbi:hypothetical protein DFJ77DRAFT_132928 [Powellomyces hirtus]|nr:hypothetical protein DFJ77DRAFT_132928 [Powellomyces hirtus]